MSVQIEIILILSVLVCLLFWLWRKAIGNYQELSFRKTSLSSRYGKMTEQFMPFLKDFPYDPTNFRFIGSPIDGIQFNEDKIIFVEFKTADSALSARQKQIAELVWQKKVEFEEYRME